MDIVFLGVDGFKNLVPTGNELVFSILPQVWAYSKQKSGKWSELRLPLPPEG